MSLACLKKKFQVLVIKICKIRYKMLSLSLIMPCCGMPEERGVRRRCVSKRVKGS